VELRSSRDLLAWLTELGSTRAAAGALKRGEYLLSLATSEGKITQPPHRFTDWLYELHDRGWIVFDDSDATETRDRDENLSRRDVHLIRGIAVTAAGRASLRSQRQR
jgi:hypothetical protein